MARKTMSLYVPDDLLSEVNETAEADFRKQQDQVRYLIRLGLETRAAVLSDFEALKKTQLNMPATDEERAAMLERIR